MKLGRWCFSTNYFNKLTSSQVNSYLYSQFWCQLKREILSWINFKLRKFKFNLNIYIHEKVLILLHSCMIFYSITKRNPPPSSSCSSWLQTICVRAMHHFYCINKVIVFQQSLWTNTFICYCYICNSSRFNTCEFISFIIQWFNW